MLHAYRRAVSDGVPPDLEKKEKTCVLYPLVFMA